MPERADRYGLSSVRLDIDVEPFEVVHVPGEDRLFDDVGGRADDHVAVTDGCTVVP